MALIRDIAIGMSVNPGQFTAGMKVAERSLYRFSIAAKQTQAAVTGMDFRPATAGISAVRASIGGLGTALAGLGIIRSVVALKSGITGAIGSASDLNEQISKSQVVFGAASASVEAKAKEMGDAFGYPKAQFIEGASSIGLIAKASGLSQKAAAGMGSAFASLAADASSFYNVPVDEALGAIRSGLVGEAEPMRRFGVLLNEAAVKAEAARLGIAKMGADLTEGQKVQARASLITKGLSDAQGDLARTASSVANMARTAEGRWTNAMAEMGAAIQPITEKLYGLRDSALRTLTEAINNNAEAIKAWAIEAGGAGGAAASAFEGVGKVIGFAADTIQTLKIGLLSAQALLVNIQYSGVNAFLSIGMAIGDTVRELAGMAPVARDNEKAVIASLKADAEAINKQLAAAAGAPWASEAIAKKFAAIAAAKPAVAGAAAAKPAAGGPEDMNAKATKSANDLVTSLRAELATFGMVGKAAEIYKLKLAGATDAQLALVKSLDMQLQGKKLKEEFRSPLEKLGVERDRFQGLFNAGEIDKKTFGRAMQSAREGLGMSTSPRFAGAVTAGSAEAYSSQLRFATRDTAKDEPMKATAKSTKENVDISKQILGALNKLIDKGIGKVGEAAAELFPI